MSSYQKLKIQLGMAINDDTINYYNFNQITMLYTVTLPIEAKSKSEARRLAAQALLDTALETSSIDIEEMEDEKVFTEEKIEKTKWESDGGDLKATFKT